MFITALTCSSNATHLKLMAGATIAYPVHVPPRTQLSERSRLCMAASMGTTINSRPRLTPVFVSQPIADRITVETSVRILSRWAIRLKWRTPLAAIIRFMLRLSSPRLRYVSLQSVILFMSCQVVMMNTIWKHHHTNPNAPNIGTTIYHSLWRGICLARVTKNDISNTIKSNIDSRRNICLKSRNGCHRSRVVSRRKKTSRTGSKLSRPRKQQRA